MKATVQSISFHRRIRNLIFFFFQAEDGIRDLTVTGVQTCALPIWLVGGLIGSWMMNQFQAVVARATERSHDGEPSDRDDEDATQRLAQAIAVSTIEIGRASGRERG